MVFIVYVSATHRFPRPIPDILNLTVTYAGDCRGMYSSGEVLLPPPLIQPPVSRVS